MTIDEQTRHALHNRLDEALGAEHAATLMSYLPPVGWADVATKQDLALVRRDIVALGKDVEVLRSDIGKDMEVLRSDIGKDMEVLRSGLGREFADRLHDTIGAQTRQLLFGLAGAVAASVGLVVGGAQLFG
jgi:hypothetical protein